MVGMAIPAPPAFKRTCTALPCVLNGHHHLSDRSPLVPDRLEKQWVLWSAEAGLQSQVNLQSHLWSPRPEDPLWRS